MRSIDLIALMVLTRILTPSDFGVIAMSKAIVFILEAVTELPISSALIRQNKITDAMLNTALTLAILRGVLISTVILIVAYPLANFYHEPRVANLMIAISLSPLFRGITSPKIILLIKEMDFKRQIIQDNFGKLVALALSLLYAFFCKDYWALVILIVAAPAFTSIISFILSPMRFMPSLSEWVLFKDIIGWNFLCQTFTAINWQLERILLPLFIDSKNFGFYSIYGDFVGMAYNTVLVPVSSPVSVSFQNGKSKNTLTQKYNLTLNVVFSLVAPIYGFIACFPDYTILLFFGEKWLQHSYILQCLSLFAIIGLPSILIAPLANILYQNKSITIRAFIELVVNLPVTLIAVKYYGINGALFARFISSVVIALVSINIADKFILCGLKSHLIELCRPVLALLITHLIFSDFLLLQYGQHLVVQFILLGIWYLTSYFFILMFSWLILGRKNGIEQIIFSKLLHYFIVIKDKLNV